MIAHKPTLDQRQDSALKPGDDLDVVRRHEHGRAPRGDVFEEVHDPPGRLQVEIAGWLVRDQKRRLGNHRSGHRNSLLLAAGQLMRKRAGAVA